MDTNAALEKTCDHSKLNLSGVRFLPGNYYEQMPLSNFSMDCQRQDADKLDI